MEKIIRNVDEKLWREAKAQAALEGKSVKALVEEIILQYINSKKKIEPAALQLYKSGVNKTKIIRGVDEKLWRKAKASAALEGISMKEWVEGVIASGLYHRSSSGDALLKLKNKGNPKKMKILRNVNEQLWREAKACAAMEGKTMKDWVEGVVEAKLVEKGEIKKDILKNYKGYGHIGKTKILRNINEQLWGEAKARAALEGMAMKDWVESSIAERIVLLKGKSKIF